MAIQITKNVLSASAFGKQILVTATVSASATPIHTAVAGTASLDEIWLYASNATSASVTCSILWGGTSEPTDVVKTLINPYSGRVLIADGKLLQNGLVVSAYSTLSSSLVIDGFINRYS